MTQRTTAGTGSTGSHRERTGSGGARARPWRAAVAASVLALALTAAGPALAAGPTGPTGPSGPTATTGSGGAGPAGGVACLDARLQPAERCPVVHLAVALSVEAHQLTVRARNAGPGTWPGGPVAVELPLPGAGFDEPSGAVDPAAAGVAGGAGWTTRAGVVVGRCAFEPVPALAVGADLACHLPTSGLGDGDHVLWFTGFVGGLPAAAGDLGDAPPAVGVVPVAASRSLRFRLAGDEVEVLGAATRPDPAAPASADDEAGFPVAATLVVLGLLVVGAAAGWLGRRRPGTDRGAR